MKNTELFSALGKIDEKYIDEASLTKSPRRLIFIRFAAVAACFCIILMAAFSLFIKPPTKGSPLPMTSSNNAIASNSESSLTSNTTKPSAQNGIESKPLQDACEFVIIPYNNDDDDDKKNNAGSSTATRGDSDYSSITFSIGDGRVYRQIKESGYEKLGIKKSISSSDFGEKLGEISKQETDHIHQDCRCISSEKIYLNGCEVYKYAPISGEAIVIVKGNGHISLFEFYYFEPTGHDFREVLDVYGIDGADDIENISVKKLKESGKTYKTVTNTESIASVYKVLTEIDAFTTDDTHSKPDWLKKAYEEYNKTSNGKYMLIVELNFKNKLSYSFAYEPFLASGYIQDHEFLSAQQNELLKSILN